MYKWKFASKNWKLTDKLLTYTAGPTVDCLRLIKKA